MEQSMTKQIETLLKKINKSIGIILDQADYKSDTMSLYFSFEESLEKKNVNSALSDLNKFLQECGVKKISSFLPFANHYFNSKCLNFPSSHILLVLNAICQIIRVLKNQSEQEKEKEVWYLFGSFYQKMDKQLKIDEKEEMCFGLCRFISKDCTGYGLLKRMELSSMGIDQAKQKIDQAFSAYVKTLKLPPGYVFPKEMKEQVAKGVTKALNIEEVMKIIEGLDEDYQYPLPIDSKHKMKTEDEKRKEMKAFALSKLLRTELEDNKTSQAPQESINEEERKQSEQIPKQEGKQIEQQDITRQSVSQSQNDNSNLQGLNLGERNSNVINVLANQQDKSEFSKEKETNEESRQDLTKKFQDLEMKYQALQALQLKQKEDIDVLLKQKEDFEALKAEQLRQKEEYQNNFKAMENRLFQFSLQQQLEQGNTVKNVQQAVNQAATEKFNFYKKTEAIQLLDARTELIEHKELEKTLKAYLRLPVIRSFCKGLLIKYKNKYAYEANFDSYKSLKEGIVKGYPNTSRDKTAIITKALESCIKLIDGINNFVHQRNTQSKTIKFDVDTAQIKDEYIQGTIQQFLSPLEDKEVVKSGVLETKDIDQKSIVFAFNEFNSTVDEILQLSNMYHLLMKQ